MRTLSSLWTLRSDSALEALRSLRTLRSLRALGSGSPLWSNRSLRPRYLANNISRLKDWTETHHYPTVDVFAAFMAHPGWQKTLMDPKSVIHPSPAGYRVWASAVEKVLAG